MNARTPTRLLHVRGQAMTELLITATFILIPLLLLIVLLGKYIDLRHTTIQAARYEAWEYTVWYADNSQTPSGFQYDQPIKSQAATQREARRRFYSDTSINIDSNVDDAGWIPTEGNPLWTYHTGDLAGQSFFGNSFPMPQGAESNPDVNFFNSSDSTPDLTQGVMNIIIEIIDLVFGTMADFIDLVAALFGGDPSPVEFDVMNINGYSRARVVVPIQTPPGLIDVRTMYGETGGEADIDVGTLNFSAQAGVLTDAWNAGGVSHVQDRAGGIIPTRLLKELLDAIPGLNTIIQVISIFVPEFALCGQAHPIPAFDPERDGSLWLGYVNIDAVPPDRLEGGTGSVSCHAGLCAFDSEVVRSPCGGI